MPFENDDLGIEFIWTGTGLGNIVVAGGSALPGRRTPPAGKDGDTVHFRIVNLDDQSEIEMTSGVWTDATQTLARTTVYYPPSGKVSFSAGDKLVSSVFGIAQAQALVESPAQTGNIASGAVTAHQIYTGALSAPSAVAGIVDIDFSSIGTTVDFIQITDATTLHVDLTTPAARRNVDIYNNTAEGVTFDVRDASDVVITSNVHYRHLARLGHSGTVWVGKAVLAVLGHKHTEYVEEDSLGTLAFETAPLDVDKGGTGQTNLSAVRSSLGPGTTIGQLVQSVDVGGSAGLPVMDGSNLTGIGAGFGNETPDSNTSITVGAANATHKALTGTGAITLALSQTAAVGVRQAFTPQTTQIVTVDPASQARYLVPGDTDASATTAPSAAWTSSSGANTTITASATLPLYTAGQLFEVRNHSTAGNNGTYIATGSPTTSSLPATKVSGGTNPVNAASEAVDIDTLQRQANFTLTGYGEFEVIGNTGGNAAVWRFAGESNLPQAVDGALTVKSIGETSPADTGFGGAESVNYENGAVVAVTLTSNVSSLTITNEPATGKASAITFIINHGSGPFTWSHPANTDWAGGTPPTLSSGANDVDILTYITRDGGTNWFGFVGGLDFA